MSDVDWNKKSVNLLKSEMARLGIDYQQLIEKLAEIGIEESYAGLVTKINRGKFTMAFFMQCMEAIGVKEVRF